MKKFSKKLITSSVVGFLIFSLSVTATPLVAAGECPKYDLAPLFFEEYYGSVRWDNSVSPKEITWSTNVTSIEGEPIVRQMSISESEWLQASFDSWDMALDTINFRRVTDSLTANIIVGLVPINDNGFWTVEQRGEYRVSGTIKLSTVSAFLTTRNGFIEAAQSEIGNLLGLGDISDITAFDSVMKDPDTAPYGSIPLSDFDIDLIRQFYGESTCHSDWSQPLKDSKAAALAAAEAFSAAAKADAAAALVKAAAEAQEKLDAERRDALLRMDIEAETARKAKEKTDRAEILAFKASLKGKKTISCVKGKLIKKVVGINPVCPKGYKKK